MTPRDFVKQFISIRPVVIEDFPEAQNVFMQVTNQVFCFTKYGCETLEDAEWMQEQLRVALAKVIQDWQEMEEEKSAAAIEELIETLKPFADIATELSDEIGDRKNTMHWAVPYAGDLRRALAVLTRRGVKL